MARSDQRSEAPIIDPKPPGGYLPEDQPPVPLPTQRQADEAKDPSSAVLQTRALPDPVVHEGPQPTQQAADQVRERMAEELAEILRRARL